MDLTRSQSAKPLRVQSLSPAMRANEIAGQLEVVIERTTAHCTLQVEFSELRFINHLEFEAPVHLLAEISWSTDGAQYFRVHGIKHESRGDLRVFDFPLVESRFMLLHIYEEGGFVHRSEIKRLMMSFESKASIKCTSTADRLWTAENLFDRREAYGWASMLHAQNQPDTIDIDLGGHFFVSEIRMRSTQDEFNAFPVAFHMQVSEDNAIWQIVQSEDRFLAAPLIWNAWRIAAKKARYVRITIDKHAHYKKAEYQSKILDIAILGEADSGRVFMHYHAENSLRLASENTPGMVLLAGNNIAAPNRVVQSNDARLRPASTEYRGVMQFARDGECQAEKALQSNDSRIAPATEITAGIVQLARDGENRMGAAVQGNDSRLRYASSDAPGIVKLAREGEARAGAVLQSNDARLKEATTHSAGLVKLAGDGEALAGKVVQGNDMRLRVATQSWPGIVQIAAPGEVASGKAIAADDSRLIEADDTRKGRVQFARKNESADMKAVQASDPRLQPASHESHGTVQFARDGIAAAGQAVEANDSRLSDSRTPKSHTHAEYAAVEHSFSSHSGALRIKRAEKTQQPDAIAFASDAGLPLFVENSEGLSAGFSGGIVVQASATAAHIFSKTGSALQGVTLDGAAATLISGRGYALHLPRQVAGLKGSEKAILAEGVVDIEGSLNIKGVAAISVALPKVSNEAFVDGDLLAIENGVASKMKNSNQVCVGVAMKNSGLQLESGVAAIRAAVAGVVSLRVYGVTKAGDQLVLNSNQPGTCKAQQESGGGKVVAVALESSQSDREKPVLAMLIR